MSTTLSLEAWKHRTAQGLALLAGPSRGEKSAPVADDLTPDDLIKRLNALCQKKLESPVVPTPPPRPIALDEDDAPSIEPANEYFLVRLNASTAISDMVSSQTGGILYEDVFWALLAARNIAAHSKHCLPLAATNKELWEHSVQASQAVQKPAFREATYFVPITEFYGTDSQPVFSLVKLNGAQLTTLRHDGMLTTFADGGLTFFQFYSKPKK